MTQAGTGQLRAQDSNATKRLSASWIITCCHSESAGAAARGQKIEPELASSPGILTRDNSVLVL